MPSVIPEVITNVSPKQYERNTCSYKNAKIYYMLVNNKAYIYQVRTTENSITIPATIGGKPVVYIHESTFYHNPTVEQVIFNNKEPICINEYALCSGNNIANANIKNLVFNGPFEICSTKNNNKMPARLISNHIKNINIGPIVKTIPESAFASMSGLETITAENITEINYGAFDFCKNLKQVYMPSVIKIDDYAFTDCLNLPADTKTSMLKKCHNIMAFVPFYKYDHSISDVVRVQAFERFSDGIIKRQRYKNSLIIDYIITENEVMITNIYQSEKNVIKKAEQATDNTIIPERIEDTPVTYIAHIDDEYINTKRITINTKNAIIEGFNMIVDIIDLRKAEIGEYTYLDYITTDYIYLPDTIKCIPSYMFTHTLIGKSKSRTIDLKNAEIIKDHAFAHSLLNCDIKGDEIKIVELKAFYDTYPLQLINIPSCSVIKDYAFSNGMSRIIVSQNTQFTKNALLDYDTKKSVINSIIYI